MRDVAALVNGKVKKLQANFERKPIVIGGMCMEYYGIRKAGADLDLVITNEDYQKLAERYPEQRKDLYGDLGVTIDDFEIWRSIAHLDYEFFRKEAVEEEMVYFLSLDRLLWTRVCAMDVEKYRKDLELIREYYYKCYTNQAFHEEAKQHEESYRKMNGAVFGGKYIVG